MPSLLMIVAYRRRPRWLDDEEMAAMSMGRDDKSSARADTEPPAGPDTDQLNRRIVVAPSRAWHMLDIGATRGYELLAAHELDSYVDGRSRRITVASIESFIARRLAASSTVKLRGEIVEPAVRAKKQRRALAAAPPIEAVGLCDDGIDDATEVECASVATYRWAPER